MDQKLLSIGEAGSLRPQASWLVRTFSTMGEGSLRAQIFLLIITTMGSSFFLLPYSAKQIGIAFVLIMLTFSAAISYTSSAMLYMGYKETGAKTYNECVTKILGRKLGYFSNIIVFMHTFTAVLSSWIFAFEYLTSGVQELFGFDETWRFFVLYKTFFFAFTLLVMFIATLASSLEKLRLVAIIGIGFIFYLVGVFAYLTPEYYRHYSSQGKVTIHWFKADPFFLKTFGICFYIFLNQYTILPVCNNVKSATFRRASKIIYRSIFTLLFLYFIIITCGYLSEPDDTKTEIFLLRKAIEGSSDFAILIGKIGFGITLMIAVTVKSTYLLLYLHELINGFSKVFSNSQESEEYRPEVQDKVPDSENRASHLSDDESQVHHASPAAERTTATHITNFVFLFLMAVSAILLMDKLPAILSLAGSFIGYFEIVFFPALLVLSINKNSNLISPVQKFLLISVSLAIGVCCIGSIGYNLSH